MFERINKLRDELMNTTPSICVERARIFTRTMKETIGQPIIKRRTEAYTKVLGEMSIFIREGELLVGNQAEKLRSAPVYPEYATQWIIDELNGIPYYCNERPNDKYQCSEEDKKELLEILGYWSDKNLYVNLRKLLPEKILKAWDLGIIDDDWVTQSGFGNVMPDYGKLLKTGLNGVIQKAQDKLNSLDMLEPGAITKKWFLEAVIDSNNAVINYAKRYSVFLADLAEKENNPARKAELQEMSRICNKVPAEPAETMWEALQEVWFIHLGVLMETNGIAISFGRFDQYIYPFYKNDIEKGIIDKDDALELIEDFFIKCNEISVFRSWQGAKFFPGYHWAANLCIGGQTLNGEDAVNEVSYLCLTACEHVLLPRPSLSVRWFEGTSQEFLDACMKTVQIHKGGQPAFYNDKGVMKMLKMHGIEKEDRLNWAPLGCIEATIPGKFDFACKGPRMNVAKVFDVTIHKGKDPFSGITCHEGVKDLSQLNSIDELWMAFKEQLHYFMELQVELEHTNDEMHKLLDLNVFRASLIEDCIGRCKTLIEGGSKYSIEGGPSVGVMTCADSFAGIQQAVFDMKYVSGEALLHALDTDFTDTATSPSGPEIKNYLANKVSKFGNDDDFVDKWAVAIEEYIGSTYIKEFKNSRFGQGPIPATFAFCQSSVTANVAMGENVGATPDGRKSRMPINNGISPSSGAERNGLTATFNSLSKLPSIWFSRGAIFNTRLVPQLLLSEEGRKKAIAAMETLFLNDQYHVQFNVVSDEVLRDAQEHPYKYGNLMVRVAGYSAFFAPLNSKLQEDIIRRVAQE